MDTSSLALIGAVFVASIVEMVEALTIVFAMAITRGWRSALAGAAAAVVVLIGFTVVVGYALVTWLPESALQLAVGTLLLIFGLQWLRKAVLRSSGLKAIHDEDEEFAKQSEAGRAAAADNRFGLDWFGFVISFKGVFLEGVEVVFIVITFGLNADNVPVAAAGAAAGVIVVLALGSLVRGPLTRIPENTLKYGVGLLLATFGTFWAVEGLGILAEDRESLEWIGGDLMLFVILLGWLALSRALVVTLRRDQPPAVRTPDPVVEGR